MGPSPDALFRGRDYLDVDGGIQVTGSHNPADYNGFKMVLKGRSVFGEEIQGARPALGEGGDWTEGTGTTSRKSMFGKLYVDRLLEGFAGKAFRIGWDAGNGAAGPVLEKLVEQSAGRASHDLHRGRRHVPQPPSRSDRREESRRS